MARPRGTGSLYRQKGSSVWWVKYYRNGKAYRESTHKTDEKEAQDFLTQRLGEIVTGNFSGPKTERVRIDELADDLLRDYRINGKRSLDDLDQKRLRTIRHRLSDRHCRRHREAGSSRRA